MDDKVHKKGLPEELKTLTQDIHRQSREVLERRLFELAVAYYIGKEISSIFNLEGCLTRLADRIADLMSVEIVSLMLVERGQNELVIKLAKGLGKKIITESKVKVGEEIVGWVAKTGQPLLIEDITKDPRFHKRKKSSKYYTNSLLSVPLKIRDRVIGVINVNNKTSRDIFRENDLDMLKTVADLAATTIENVRLQEEAKALDRLRTDFVANVSHELRTPLAAIKEIVELMLDEITGGINDKQKKLLILARENIERLRRMIDDLLNLVRLEAGKETMERKLFNIVELVDKVSATLEPLAKDKEISLKILLPDKKIEMWGDADKLYEVMINLIDNAIKYNKPKGSVKVSLEDAGGTVKICVSDTGVGIHEQDLDNVFDRFRRAEMRDKSIKGTGLGLSITKEIIHMHGGEISIESQFGKGTEFTVILPKDLRGEDR